MKVNVYRWHKVSFRKHSILCHMFVLSVSIESQEPCKCSSQITFTTPCQSLHLTDINECRLLLHNTVQYSSQIQQTDTPFSYSKEKATIYVSMLVCVCEQDRKTVAVRWSLFPRQQQAPYRPHKLDSDPRTGFPLTPCLCRARADPACDSSRLCVMASVLLAFHNRPQLPELFPSPSHLTAMKERLLHTLKSHFRRSIWQNANSLGHINVLFILCDLRNY